MADPTLARLAEASQGLLFPSETDAPFEAFVWEAADNSAASVRRFSGEADRFPCRTLTLGSFLQDLVEEPPFLALKESLERTLAGIQVYRFGDLDPTYYVVGTDGSGRLAGLKTHAVET